MNTKIKKRDGRLVKFNADKITSAIAKACAATGEFDMKEARKLTIKVLNLTEQLFNGKILSWWKKYRTLSKNSPAVPLSHDR